MTHAVTAAITTEDFAALIAACGPFEARPVLAGAVSGGADSLALVLLADAWARARGGSVVALTVDHALRPASGAEAEKVQGWMAARGIAHHILTWGGTKPAQGLQAAARAARYGLLADWCRAAGVVHLLLGHHRDDQAETVRLRTVRGSGAAGLAAMAPVAPPPVAGPRWPRLLRPLLPVTKAALVQTLRAWGQPWIEDPSNANSTFTRVAIRAGLDDAERAALAAEATAARHARTTAEARLAVAALPVIALYPEGYARLVRPALAALAAAERRALWQRVLTTVGGRIYPPRGDHLDRLLTTVAQSGFAGATLAGCRIVAGERQLLVTRELAAAGAVALGAEVGLWDGRFWIGGDFPSGVSVRPLGAGGWRALGERREALRPLPHPVRLSLPALYVGERLLGLPQIIGGAAWPGATVPGVTARFQPPQAFLY